MKAKNLGRLAVALMGVGGVSLSNPITYDLSFAQRVTYFARIL